jgi:hypothetical protein
MSSRGRSGPPQADASPRKASPCPDPPPGGRPSHRRADEPTETPHQTSGERPTRRPRSSPAPSTPTASTPSSERAAQPPAERAAESSPHSGHTPAGAPDRSYPHARHAPRRDRASASAPAPASRKATAATPTITASTAVEPTPSHKTSPSDRATVPRGHSISRRAHTRNGKPSDACRTRAPIPRVCANATIRAPSGRSPNGGAPTLSHAPTNAKRLSKSITSCCPHQCPSLALLQPLPLATPVALASNLAVGGEKREARTTEYKSANPHRTAAAPTHPPHRTRAGARLRMPAPAALRAHTHSRAGEVVAARRAMTGTHAPDRPRQKDWRC